jgi:hypothetical protein
LTTHLDAERWICWGSAFVRLGELAKEALREATEDLERERVERAKAESTAHTLQAELTELRGESRRTLEMITSWVERVTRAEVRLEERKMPGVNSRGNRGDAR